MLIYVIYRLIQHDTGCTTVHAVCESHFLTFRDKLLYDFDSVHVSKTTYYSQYIRKSIQTKYSISKYTFKLMKPLETYKKNLLYHNFLPPPRRESHVKSDNTHMIINIYPEPIYLTSEP